jgi:ABC-type polar amino acid transport system ATPase subunit
METPERVDLNQILLAAHAYKLPIKLSGVQQQRMALGGTTGGTTMVEAV